MVAHCSLICISLMISDVEHLFMCLLVICIIFFGEMTIQVFCLFLKLGYLLFCCWVVRILHVFWILISHQINDLQTFSPILWVVFLFCWYCLLLHTFFFFSFSLSPVCLFFLLFPVPVVPYPRNHCLVQYHEDFALCFLLRILWSGAYI